MDTVYSRLRHWRRSLADQLGLPPFFVLSNRHLAGVAAALPATLEDLARCPGLGPKRLAQFGEELVAQVNQCLAEGLEPGIPLPEPEGSADFGAEGLSLSPDDMLAIVKVWRRDTAARLAKRLSGRFTPAQVEEALQIMLPTLPV